jgi:hypothetical protein
VIRALDDLIALSNLEADKTASEGFVNIAEEVRLRKPGCTPDEMNRIRTALLGIPESYLSVAAYVALPKVSIGNLTLAPGRPQDESLFDRLTHANSPAWPLWDFVNHHCLYHVADYEGDMICVVRDGKLNAGEILRIDLSCPPTPELHRTAWSFEQLMLGFGRLREQFLEERFGPDAIDEVLASLVSDFELDAEQTEDWAWFAEVALSDDEVALDDTAEVPAARSLDAEGTILGTTGPGALGQTSPRFANTERDADIVSEYQRPRPEGYDRFAAIPTWPDWQVDNFVQLNGSVNRFYWSRYEGHAYQLAQWPGPNGDRSDEIYAIMAPHIRLLVVKGTPKPWNPDWDLREVARYPLQGIEPWVEAQEEIAKCRRRLPELLAEAAAKKKK